MAKSDSRRTTYPSTAEHRLGTGLGEKGAKLTLKLIRMKYKPVSKGGSALKHHPP
jgi:hypothetical protein